MAVANPDEIFEEETINPGNEPKIQNTMLTLPTSFAEAAKLASSVRAHVGLGMSWKSYRAHRATNVASIFLFGRSGAGKSSTLNHLFGCDLIPTSSRESCTRDVTEYGCTMESTHWKAYGDTKGPKEDAKNLATISEYVSTQFTSWTRFTRSIYPNIVLVVVNSSDNRMFGIYSEFSKMLHVLSQLNVVDRERPNVVFAFTHALTLGKKLFSVRAQKIAEDCAILSRLHLLFEAPVVFLENEDEDDELKEEGDFKILPDGTKQPFNLYQAMMDLMKKSGDEVGVEAIRIFFSNAKDYTSRVKPRNKTPQVSENTNAKSISYWESRIKEEFLESQAQGELYDILLKPSLDPALCLSESEAMVLAHNLRKAQITKRSDIENKLVGKINNALLPYVLNDKEIQVLSILFKLRQIDKLKFDLLGLGYSWKEEETKSRILDVPTKELLYDKGIYVPQHFTNEQCSAVSIDIKYYTNEKGRIIPLSLALALALPFALALPLLSLLFREKNIKIKFTIRFLSFKVKMEETAKLALNEEFSKFLKECFCDDNCEPAAKIASNIQIDPISKFDEKYERHCISGLHFGGSLNGFACFLPENEDSLIQHVGKIRCHLESYLDYLMSHNHPDPPPYKMEDEIFDDLKKCQLTWRGGDKQFYSKTLGDLTPKSWYDWTDSLHDNLVLLDDHINTTSLFDILNVSKDGAMRQHAKYFESTTSPQPDPKDLYYFTTPDFSSKQFNQESSERISTRVKASAVYKSEVSHCNIL